MIRRVLVVLLVVCLGIPAGAVITPPELRRPADQTFLTYPEWFLVFSPAEYAAFVRSHPPSEFPFLGHIRQFWQGYDAVWRATRGRYPFNAGYHVMILVIGTSTTIEYALRLAYETLIGRLSEPSPFVMTPEDRFGARVAQQYVDFIRLCPWYEFDFASRLVDLWRTTGLTGRPVVRKWERKYWLTTEYASKAVYAWLITKATKTAYEDPLPTTEVVVDGRRVTLPRYEAFMSAASALARNGARFQEVAGNRGTILISVLTRGDGRQPYEVILTQPILTQPGKQRLLLSVPVAQLSDALNLFNQKPFELEHVYDF